MQQQISDLSGDDPPPSLHGHYPASTLLRGTPPLSGASVLSASRLEPLVPFPLASPARFSRSIQVDHRHCRPAANETMLGLRRAVGTEVVHWLGANKPAYKLDPGFLEHPRLSPRAVIGPGARFLDFLFTGAPRRRRNPRGGDWPTLATPLRSSPSRPRHKHVEPRSRYRREFAAWREQVSFFLGQDGSCDVRRRHSRRVCPHSCDHRGGISFCAQELR